MLFEEPSQYKFSVLHGSPKISNWSHTQEVNHLSFAKSQNFTTLIIKVFGYKLHKYHKNFILIVHKMNINSLSLLKTL